MSENEQSERMAVLEERVNRLLAAVEKLTEDVNRLVGLRNAGAGFVAAISLFGSAMLVGLIELLRGALK